MVETFRTTLSSCKLGSVSPTESLEDGEEQTSQGNDIYREEPYGTEKVQSVLFIKSRSWVVRDRDAAQERWQRVGQTIRESWLARGSIPDKASFLDW